MASRAEQLICQSLRPILANLPNGAQINDAEQFQKALDGLEFWLPGVLGPDWNDELDGFHVIIARKIGEEEVEIFGLCILISDQALTPIHLQLQIAPGKERISWLACKIGECGDHGMVRTPYSSLDAALKRVYKIWFLEGSTDKIDWAYDVTFGRRRI